MDNETIEDFARYRLNKAKETLETAKMIFNEGKDFSSANNRAYYSIFYAIRAVLAMDKVDFKRHKDVLAYFNKNFVKTEIFPRQIGRKIVLASKLREDSDYDEEYEPSSETTALQIETAKELIELVEKYLNNLQSE